MPKRPVEREFKLIPGLKMCPVPGCHHMAEILTRVHFRQEHNMERADALKKYGEPKRLEKKSGFSDYGREKLWRERGMY